MRVLSVLMGLMALIPIQTTVQAQTDPPPLSTEFPFGGPDNLVPNTLDQWQSDSWGKGIQATVNDDQIDPFLGRVFSVQIQDYHGEGDAKWNFRPQSVSQGMEFTYRDFYKANVIAKTMARFIMSDGSERYTSLRNPTPEVSMSTWNYFSDTFMVPYGAKGMSIVHLISDVGTLMTTGQSLKAWSPKPLNRALVSLTFDDGFSSQATTALPLLKQYKALGTFYLVPGFFNKIGYMTPAQAADLKAAGEQIGDHTMDHRDLTSVPNEGMANELNSSQDFLKILMNDPIQDFASPEGLTNERTLAAIKQVFRSHRSIDQGFNSQDSFDIYNLKVQNIYASTTPAEVRFWLDKAISEKTWLIIVYHQVDNAGGDYSVTPQNFEAELANISQSGIQTVTIEQGIQEVLPQVKS